MKRIKRYGGWSLVVSAVVASLALGCFRPKYYDCNIKCGPRRMCPEQMTCLDGYCTHARGCGSPKTDASADVQDGPDGPDAPDTPDATDATDATDAQDVSDASDAPEGDVASDTDAAPWTPAVIPNLVLWLESDRGLDATPGAKVLEWRDQSPLHNDARQTAEMFAPKLAAVPFNGVAGLEFSTKAWMVINDDPSLSWGVGDFLVLVVYRSTARCLEGSCILQQLYRKQEVDPPWRGPGLGIQPGGRIEVHLDHSAAGQWLASPGTGYDSGRIHLVGALRRMSWPSERIDGTDFPGAPPSAMLNLDAPGANVYFGAHGLNPDPPIDFPFSGYIGAIVAVQGSISTTDLTQLESYLMAKYGATPGGPP